MIHPVAREIGRDLDGKPYTVNSVKGDFIIKGQDAFNKVVVEIHPDEMIDVFIHDEGKPTMNIVIKASTLIEIIKKRCSIKSEEEDVVQIGDPTMNNGSTEVIICLSEDDILGR